MDGTPLVDIHFTCALYLNIIANQVHHFMTIVFPGECGLFQQDNAPCHSAHIVQEEFEKKDEFKNTGQKSLIRAAPPRFGGTYVDQQQQAGGHNVLDHLCMCILHF